MRPRLIVLSLLAAALSSSMAPRHWTGTTDGLWSKASNWGGTAPVANDDLIFDNATNVNPTTNDFPAGTGFNSLTFNATPNTFSVGGNSVALGAGGITQVSGSTFNSFLPLTLSASQTWTTAASGGFFLNPLSSLDLGANTLNVAGTGDLNITNTTIGSGPINLGGPGSMTIRSHLNSTGVLTVGSGALLNLATPDAFEPPVVVNSGGSITVPNGSSGFMNRALTFNPGSTFVVVLNGTSATQIGRITVNNQPVTIAGGLSVTNNAGAPLGTSFGILNAQNSSTITGTFTGFPNNSTFNAGGQTFQINYSAFSVVLTVVSGTNTTLTSSLNPSNFGDSVTFTATVSPTATGSVTFFDGTTNLGSASLNGSSQTAISLSSLSVGSHSMSAVYNGNGTQGSSTGTLTQQVNASVPTMNEYLLMVLGVLLAAAAAIALRRRAAV